MAFLEKSLWLLKCPWFINGYKPVLLGTVRRNWPYHEQQSKKPILSCESVVQVIVWKRRNSSFSDTGHKLTPVAFLERYSKMCNLFFVKKDHWKYCYISADKPAPHIWMRWSYPSITQNRAFCYIFSIDYLQILFKTLLTSWTNQRQTRKLQTFYG